MLNIRNEASVWKPLSVVTSGLVPRRSYLRSLSLGQLPTTGYHPITGSSKKRNLSCNGTWLPKHPPCNLCLHGRRRCRALFLHR